MSMRATLLKTGTHSHFLKQGEEEAYGHSLHLRQAVGYMGAFPAVLPSTCAETNKLVCFAVDLRAEIVVVI